MNNMDFSLPPLSKNEAIIPAVIDKSFATSAPAAPVSEASIYAAPISTPTESIALQNNPAFRAHLARLKSLREKVMQQHTESIISFDYRQPPTLEPASVPASASTSASLSEREQLEVAEQFLSKLERLVSESYQGRNQSR